MAKLTKPPMNGVIYHDNEKYTKGENHKEAYITQLAKAVSNEFGISAEDAKQEVREALHGKYHDPVMKYYKKDRKTEDRHYKESPISTYYSIAEGLNLTMAPSMTCYTKRFSSVDAIVMGKNKVKRNTHKGRAKVAESANDMATCKKETAIQKTMKIKNNSHSGGTTLMHLPFAAHTSHFSLTSTTASGTSLTNALAERLLSGNRIYMTFDDILDDIYTTITKADVSVWDKAIDKYKLTIPTNDSMLEVMRRGSEPYFKLDDNRALRYIKSLSDNEKVMYVYTLDIYHLEKFNPKLVAYFLRKASEKVRGSDGDFDLEFLNSRQEHDLTHLHAIFLRELSDVELGYAKYAGKDMGNDLCATMRNFDSVMDLYSDLWRAMLSTKHLVNNSNIFKDAYRRCVVLSDTDSVCAAFNYWTGKAITEKYIVKDDEGKYRELAPSAKSLMDREDSYRVATLLSYMLVSTSTHLLKQLACNINTTPDKYGKLSYKSEYYYLVFSPLNISKHYASSTKIKELIVFGNGRADISTSGVGLISANAADSTNAMKDRLLDVLKQAAAGTAKYNKLDIIKEVSDFEVMIYKSIMNGETDNFKMERINEEKRYAKPLSSNYYHYMMYVDTFASKYGEVSPPQLYTYSIPVKLNTKNMINTWVDSMVDEKIKMRFKTFFKKYPKNKMTRFLIPEDIITSSGIPDEILPIIDYRRLVREACAPVYLVSGMLGIRRDSVSDLTITETYGIQTIFDV